MTKENKRASTAAASRAKMPSGAIAVVGSGLAGLTITALLAAHDVDVICLDRMDLKTQLSSGFDGRTTAVSWGSRQVFEAIGVWEELAPVACPINSIHILDADSPVLLDFDSAEVGGRTFGWILENKDLREVLIRYIESRKSAQIMAPVTIAGFRHEEDSAFIDLADGRTLDTPLVIGADGRGSFTRESLGITSRKWSYNQRALVFNVVHEKPHHNVAVEHFLAAGPFAILPMTDRQDGRHCSSVVWTEHGAERNSVLHLGEESFNAALSARFPKEYGKVELLGGRAAFPLGLSHAHHYIGPRTALVADAAHGIHPIAGQGLNLGFRDIAVLGDLLVKAVSAGNDPGADKLLETYQRRRRFDNMAMAGATDALNKLFSNNIPPVRMLRQTGLRMVSRFPFAKQFFMKQAMGAAGILPDLIKENLKASEAA